MWWVLNGRAAAPPGDRVHHRRLDLEEPAVVEEARGCAGRAPPAPRTPAATPGWWRGPGSAGGSASRRRSGRATSPAAAAAPWRAGSGRPAAATARRSACAAASPRPPPGRPGRGSRAPAGRPRSGGRAGRTAAASPCRRGGRRTPSCRAGAGLGSGRAPAPAACSASSSSADLVAPPGVHVRRLGVPLEAVRIDLRAPFGQRLALGAPVLDLLVELRHLPVRPLWNGPHCGAAPAARTIAYPAPREKQAASAAGAATMCRSWTPPSIPSTPRSRSRKPSTAGTPSAGPGRPSPWSRAPASRSTSASRATARSPWTTSSPSRSTRSRATLTRSRCSSRSPAGRSSTSAAVSTPTRATTPTRPSSPSASPPCWGSKSSSSPWRPAASAKSCGPATWCCCATSSTSPV